MRQTSWDRKPTEPTVTKSQQTGAAAMHSSSSSLPALEGHRSALYLASSNVSPWEHASRQTYRVAEYHWHAALLGSWIVVARGKAQLQCEISMTIHGALQLPVLASGADAGRPWRGQR